MSDPDHPDNNPISQRHNSRLGLVLFAVYLLLYGGFVYLNAFDRTAMTQLYAGINLAVWYGLALIVFALVLAAIYMALCRK